MGDWVDASGAAHNGRKLAVWVFALTRVAVEARKAVLTDREGLRSRFADGTLATLETPAIVVPLPRTSKAGQAIVAIARLGQTSPDGGLAAREAGAAPMR